MSDAGARSELWQCDGLRYVLPSTGQEFVADALHTCEKILGPSGSPVRKQQCTAEKAIRFRIAQRDAVLRPAVPGHLRPAAEWGSPLFPQRSRQALRVEHDDVFQCAKQKHGAVDEVRGMANLDQMTRHNSALVEESAAAAESLRDKASSLATVAGTLRLES